MILFRLVAARIYTPENPNGWNPKVMQVWKMRKSFFTRGDSFRGSFWYPFLGGVMGLIIAMTTHP